MRLCLVARQLDMGGAERQLIELAKGLARLGDDITILSLYDGGQLSGEVASVTGVRHIGVGKRHRWDVLFPLRRMVRLVRRIQPELLQGYLPTGNVLSILLKRAAPEAKIVWGIRASQLDWSRYGWVERALFILQRLLASRPDLIIANSFSGLRDHVRLGFPREKCLVIPNGIDVGRFRRRSDGRDRVRGEWGVASDELLVGLVGRFDPMKGHEIFVRSAALLSRELHQVRFACIGAGGEEVGARLRALAERLGVARKMIWSGFRSDMPEVYSALDALAGASLFGEGSQNAIIEAMACEVPCVVTDVGDAASIVQDAGLVVAAGDHAALAAGLRRVLELPGAERKALGERARARVIEEFGSERMVSATRCALERLLRGPAVVPGGILSRS